MGALELAPEARPSGFAVPARSARAPRELHRARRDRRAIGDTLAFCPPMTITEAEIDEMFAPVEAALDATEAWARAEGIRLTPTPAAAWRGSRAPGGGQPLTAPHGPAARHRPQGALGDRLHGDGDLHQGLGAARAAGRGGVLPLVLRDPGDPRLADLDRAHLRHGLDTLYPMGHLWRGLVGTTAMGLGFTALGLLPLPEATALGYAAPLLTVIFAAMFLGEQVRAFRLTAVASGSSA